MRLLFINFHRQKPRLRQITRLKIPTASLIAQLVKNPLTMQEIPVQFLGSGRSQGKGIGYPLQYSRASLVAQLVKNLPAMWETWVWSLDGKVPWRREQLPTPVFWPGEFHGLYRPWVAKSWTWLSDFHFHFNDERFVALFEDSQALQSTFQFNTGWIAPKSHASF